MVSKRIIELLAKKTGQSATKEELEELAVLLIKYPDYAYLQELLLSLKGSGNHQERALPKDELVSLGWQHLSDELKKEEHRIGPKPQSEGIKRLPGFRKRLFWYAAASLIIFFIAAAIFTDTHSEGSLLAGNRTVKVNYGKKSSLELSDGSKVWLNAGSQLIYPQHFTGMQREVTLQGEGFFEVSKDPQRPFLVHAGKITVKVLGTVFNVKAYNDDAYIETTLLSGKVHVLMNDDPDKEIVLSPHEKLTVIKPVSVASQNVQASNELKYQVQALPASGGSDFVETAWVNNKLIANNEDFAMVATLLERKFNVKIQFENEKLKTEHLTCIFENESIKQVLDILQMTTHFDYRIEGNTVHIY